MKDYLSHYSAAAYWKIPYLETVLGSEIAETNPMDFTVSTLSDRSRKKGRIIHWCKLALPAGALVSKSDKTVASPELTFLELADKLSIHQLILLGLQLCSHSPGNPSEAITTKRKLKAFLAKTPGHRGYRKALRAVKYIENGSASFMESMAYMVLTLPHALGGYGLSGPVFNHEIKLRGKGGKRLSQKRCFADLFYKQAKLAVEYQSFTFHSSPSEQGKDMMRSAVLYRQGIQVMFLSTIQLYDKDACQDFALNLAAQLGKRIQIRTRKFHRMQGLLRALLPEAKPLDKSYDGKL